MNRKHTLTLVAALVGALLLSTSSVAQVGSYFQDFENLTQSNVDALGGGAIPGTAEDGTHQWVVSGAVFDEFETFKFFYGNFPAPNEQPGTAFSNIESGQGGAAQGSQYLNTFSDYNCCDLALPTPQGHGNGTDIVRSNILQEFIIDSSDLGRQVEFKFDAKLPGDYSGSGGDNNAPFALGVPDGNGNSATAEVFIRTIEPAPSFATSAEVIVPVADFNLSDTVWSTHSVLFDITPAFDGHFFQFGITNVSSNFQSTGVYLDNVSLDDSSTAGGILGDYDGSATVGQADLDIVLLGWGDTTFAGDEANIPPGGGVFDGNVSQNELDGVLLNWGQSNPWPLASGAATAAVPEPSSALLLLIAGSMLAAGTRSRR